VVFLKNCFVTTTSDIDCIPIIHDVRYAIRDSQINDGLVTITIPGSDASLWISQSQEGFEKLSQHHCPSLSLPFQKKELILDPQLMIYLIDFSKTGKRREFCVQVLGDAPQQPQQQGGRRR